MPAKATAKTVKTVSKTTTAAKTTTTGTKTRKRNVNSYGTYIQKVLKNVHPDIGITKESMTVMDNIIKDVYEKIVSQAQKFMKVDKRQTLTDKDISSSIKILFEDELASHAGKEGQSALKKFNAKTK